jgi:hypothetical protein
MMGKSKFCVASLLLIATFGVLLVSGGYSTTRGNSNYTPCSGKKAEPCGVAIPASDGCFYSTGQMFPCSGEVLEGPYTTKLVDGQPSNNMGYGFSYAVCMERFHCEPHWFWPGACQKGNHSGTSYVRTNQSYGDCEVP